MGCSTSHWSLLLAQTYPIIKRTLIYGSLTKPFDFNQLSWLNVDWSSILERTQLHMSLLEPFIAFRRVLLQVLSCKDSMVQHLLQSTSTLRKVLLAILYFIFIYLFILCDQLQWVQWEI